MKWRQRNLPSSPSLLRFSDFQNLSHFDSAALLRLIVCSMPPDAAPETNCGSLLDKLQVTSFDLSLSLFVFLNCIKFEYLCVLSICVRQDCLCFYFFFLILLGSVSGVLVFVSSRRRNWWIEGSGAFNAFYFPMLSRFIIELELV